MDIEAHIVVVRSGESNVSNDNHASHEKLYSRVELVAPIHPPTQVVYKV